MSRTAVVALGGNAITRSGQAGTFAEQTENARSMAAAVCRMLDAGWTVVLVHGNGPQVGNLAIQQEAGADRVPELPLFWLGAMTEGQLGCLLALSLHTEGQGRLPGVVSVITHTVVDADDPAFGRPTKPIGPFFDEAQARRHAEEQGWAVGEDAGRGYRRLVPSPEPQRIVELESIRALVDQGMIVVAAGGGGIPVVADGPGYRGVEAVIDKDLAAQRLASALDAEALVLITDVPQVMLDYGTPDARAIAEMTVDQAQAHADHGQFPEGSMGPKMRAAMQFVREGGCTSVITNAERACASLDSAGADAGTRIVSSDTRMGAAS
ncbi:carbamate kinase [Pseudonocardia sp. H11422]|uniref:carbamate kinase n=1 Tax=Pseudonocardia sp. H11422 TaxID=2835866 RepID=UPI001BDD097E|nr:carbamate kinase [Pseudonocardia sp. H11422]